MARHNFRFLSEIYDIVIIARGEGVRVRQYLNQRYGRGRWRKLKGKAIIEIPMAKFGCLKFIGLRRMESDKEIIKRSMISKG